MTSTVDVSTQGNGDMRNLTPLVREVVREHELEEGFVLAFVPGSTAAVTTIEFEPGLQRDFPDTLERIAPRDGSYLHHETWQDDNDHAHVKASLLGPSLSVPVVAGRLVLGTWQQVVLLDFDTRPRRREIVVQTHGRRLPANR